MPSCDLAAGVPGRGELARCDLLPLLCLVPPQAWSAASGPLRSERGSAGGPAGAAVVVAPQVLCRCTLRRAAAAAAVAASRPMAPARVEETGAGRKRRLPSRGLVGANASVTQTASTTLVRVCVCVWSQLGVGDDGCLPRVCVCACLYGGPLESTRLAKWHVRDGSRL
jgi:hypothetical protein